MTNVKKNIITIIVGSIVATTAMLSINQANAFESEEQAKRGGHENRKAHRGGKVFNKLDINEDGMLSFDEMLSPALLRAEKKLSKKDTDEDGFISFEEYITTQNGTKPDLSEIADEIVQCVADVKAETGNDDIEVPSADQFKSLEEKFSAIDTSGDGLISLDELQAKVTEKITNAFNNKDANEDGFVSEEEFKTRNGSNRATRRAIRSCVEEITADEVI